MCSYVSAYGSVLEDVMMCVITAISISLDVTKGDKVITNHFSFVDRHADYGAGEAAWFHS
jgi:hypothetical protein